MPKKFLLFFVSSFLFSGCSVMTAEEFSVDQPEYYTQIVEDQDPAEALAELQRQLDADFGLANSCHMIVHHIGHAAFDKYGFEEAMEFADDICGSGYMHGVTEIYVADMADPIEGLLGVCPEGYGACFHGVGHGLFMAYEGDIPTSLEGCEALKNPEEEVQCSEGVFMENFSTDMKMHINKNLDPEDPFAICAEQKDPYASACYFYAPRYYVSIHDRDYAGSLEICATFDYPYDVDCSRGTGSAMMRQNLHDHQFSIGVCSEAPTSIQGGCFAGLTSYFIIHTGNLEEARTLCPEFPESRQALCERTIEASEGFFLD